LKAYLVTTGIVFALIVVAHVARAVAEGAVVLRNPLWVLLTVLAAALATWSAYLLKTSRSSGS
jgi:hypothetical protein